MPAIPPAPGQGTSGQERRRTTNIWGTGSSQGGGGGVLDPKPTPGTATGTIMRGTGTVSSLGGAFRQPGSGNPLVDAMLALLNGGGGAAGGGGGGGGSGFNVRAARGAAQGAYEQAVGNAKNVYGQLSGNVRARQPAIAQGYADATASLNADAAARAQADAARNAEADQRNMQTADALGLGIVAPTDTQADALQQAGTNAYQANAQAWGGFNAAQSQNAQERNTATADTFDYAGAQAQDSLAYLLQQWLSEINGQASRGGGGGGGGGGGPSFGDQFKVLNALLGYDMDQQKLSAAAAGEQGGLSAISPAGWQAIQQAYGGGVMSGGQGNAKALTGLANNPQDFANLYSVLYG